MDSSEDPLRREVSSSTPETCYAYLVYKWWKEKFPQAQIEYINAGIGGTTSQFGVSRVEQHLLQKKPDFILIEFAVNDDNNEFFRETYEGLIRKTYGECKCAGRSFDEQCPV